MFDHNLENKFEGKQNLWDENAQKYKSWFMLVLYYQLPFLRPTLILM